MLKALRQNPALYAQGSMQDAVREIDKVASFGTQTLTASEILNRIRHAENSLHAARAYLDMAKAKAKHIKKNAAGRIIYRDVACRYLSLFGGHTEFVQTAADDGYPVLIDLDGETRGQVSMFDTFPKTVEIVSEIPY